MPKILLVDYDPLQALVRKSILERQFPGVQRVSDAGQALCLIEQQGFAESLDLVITGFHLPGTGGPAFVAELLERLPEIPVLVLGGPSETAADYPPGVCYRTRPIPAEELLALTAKLLAAAHAHAA